MLKGITDTGDVCKLPCLSLYPCRTAVFPSLFRNISTGAKPAGQIDCRSIFIIEDICHDHDNPRGERFYCRL